MSGDNRVKDFFQLTLLCLSFYIVLCLNSFSFSIIFIQQYSDLHHKQQNHSQEGNANNKIIARKETQTTKS